MLRKTKRILSLLLALIMICSAMGVVAFAADILDKVLLVTDTAGIEQLESLSEDELSSYAEIANYDDVELSLRNLIRYRAIAFPYDLGLTDEIQYAFEHGCIVYIYGELTIQDYKNIVGLENFAFDVNVYDVDGALRGTAVQSFPADYETTETFGVISCGDSPLLCMVERDEYPLSFIRYYKPIINNFLKLPRLNAGISPRSTIIRRGADYVTSCVAGDVYMDYILYRNFDEEDEHNDYFALRTLTWGVGSTPHYTDQVVTTHELPWENDELIETAPGAKSSAGSFTVGVSFGSEAGGSIGYTVDLSDWEPDIKRTLSLTDDTVTWTMIPKTVLIFQVGGSLDDAPLDCISTFSVNNPGCGLAEIDVTFWGKFTYRDARYTTEKRTIYVCYTYSDM